MKPNTRLLRGLRRNTAAISPIIATVMLILATLFIGAMAFTTFRSQTASLAGSVDIQVQSLDLVKAGGTSVASISVKNSGTVNIDTVDVAIVVNDGNNEIELCISDLKSGESKGADNTAFNAAWVTVGETYPIKISVVASDGSTLNKSQTVTCRSS